jgi:adenylate cyclase
VQQVAEELGARYVLEGGVRKVGRRVRITAQLIDAETGHHVWAQKFDRDLEDIFAIQDEVTQRIVAIVEPELERAERKRSAAKKPTDLDAWDNYQRGMALLYQYTKEDNRQARKMFARATKLDPSYSQPFIGLAYSHQLDILMEYTESREHSIDKLFEAARQAIALDDKDSMAHMMLCFACRWARKHDMAIAEAEKAVELNPSNAFALFHLGNVLDLAGNPDEGITNMKKGFQFNPLGRIHYLMSLLARAHLNARRYEDAVEWARKAIHHRPDHARAHAILAIGLAHLGQLAEARVALDECERVGPGFAKRWALLRQYRNPADNEHILEGLRKARLPE